MGKLKDELISQIKEEIEQNNAEIKAAKEEEKLPTPEEASKASMAAIYINPILKMAIEQGKARRVKDLYHGFK